jgi:hypothetical protein
VGAFTAVMVGIMVLFVVGILLLGMFHPKTGAQVLNWKPTRSPELEAQNEVDDIDQMLEAANERRRRRGAQELTEAGLRQEVADELRAAAERRDDYLAEEDVRQMIEAKNARRRARGEPEVDPDAYRAQLEAQTKPPAGE